MIEPEFAEFERLARAGSKLIPLHARLLSDQLTPVLAYRRLVAADERTAPSFLFESVEGGETVGRHSILGAQPAVEITARGHEVEVHDHRDGRVERRRVADPLRVLKEHAARTRETPETTRRLPAAFTGGWVGYAGYDTARYLEPEKLPFESAPPDDRRLPDLHFGLYRDVVVFDHVEKIVHAVVHAAVDEEPSLEAAYRAGADRLRRLVSRLETHAVPLPAGMIDLDLSARGEPPRTSNVDRDGFEGAVRRAKEYIAAGDAFQIVLSRRLARETGADPFDIYRALRVVNPSPYMIYLQAAGSIMVASSPEILCRVRDRVVTSRPLAGTRGRGATDADDRALELELLADEKERAEHAMLVDLARNDLGRVCETSSIRLERVMEIERYSHVMHISSTVTGRLRADLDAWDALRVTLPVGTVSGAPKVRAMQIIDELEPTRRGPYGGGIGGVSFAGDMDIALTLRTMVVPLALRDEARGTWTVHLQAGAGVVADSDPAREFEETLNKAAALGRAIDLAESAFGRRGQGPGPDRR